MNPTECFLNLTRLFENLSDYRYFATKVKTPYFYLERPFPEMYPVGRDIDVITHPDDFKEVTNIVGKFCSESGVPHRLVQDSQVHHRHRLEFSTFFLFPNADENVKRINGKPLTRLHFQFDISSIEDHDYDGIDRGPILEDMENPTIINGVKILKDGNEALMRCVFYSRSQSLHHRKFIYNFRDEINGSHILDPRIWSSVNPILS